MRPVGLLTCCIAIHCICLSGMTVEFDELPQIGFQDAYSPADSNNRQFTLLAEFVDQSVRNSEQPGDLVN
jgi:hypothetical protein